MTAQPFAGTAAGVPYIAVPPSGQGEPAPMIVAWHAFEPPRSEVALADSFPLSGTNAWRFYLGLPLFGRRLPEQGVAEVNRLGQSDFLVHLLAPVVWQAMSELHSVVAELRTRFPVGEGPFGLFGIGAGATAALLCLLDGRLPLAAVGAVNPIIDPAPLLYARERHLGVPYAWSEQGRATAAWLDARARCHELAERPYPVPLLLLTGGQDEIAPPRHGQELHDLLAPYHPAGTLRHLVVPDLAHSVGPEPGLEPAPPTPGGVLADRALGEWFRLHLGSAADAAHWMRRSPA